MTRSCGGIAQNPPDWLGRTHRAIPPPTRRASESHFSSSRSNSAASFAANVPGCSRISIRNRLGAVDLVDAMQGFTLDYVTESNWISVVPEPVTPALLAPGGLALIRRRKK